MTPSVSTQCRSCLTTLRNIVSALSKPDHDRGPVSHDQVNEEVDRFSLWAGNIGALHSPESAMSVESRLREASDVLVHILSLLGDLKEVAQELLEIAAGERDGMFASVAHAKVEANSDGEDATLFEGQDEISEENELLEEISGTITRLFRVSSLIRQAAPADLFAKALSRNRYHFNDQFDIGHVGEKYPKLATEEHAWLRVRLGRAITQRRHYLSYIQDHREKLESVTENNEKISSIAKPQTPVIQMPHTIKPKIDSASHPSTFFTKATTIVPERITTQMLIAEESDPEDDARSYTTISRSVDGDHETSTAVRIPALKDLQIGTRKEIECPFCFRMKKFKNERTWRQHVFSDLHSYVCTFPDCDAPYFGDINEWFRHEMQNHRVSFKCMLCKDRLFYEKTKYLAHVQRNHPDMLEEGEEQLVLDIARKPLDQIPARHCPCCTEWLDRLRERASSANFPDTDDTLVVNPTVFKRHLASHLEQLAMFAIPIGSETEGDIASNAAIEEVNSNQSNGPELSTLTFNSSPPVFDPQETNPRSSMLAKRVLRRWKRLVSRNEEARNIKAGSRVPSCLFVRGLPLQSSISYVKALFEKYGEVISYHRTSGTGEMSFVFMATVEQAQDALDGLHGTRMEDGEYLYVMFGFDDAMKYRREVHVLFSFWTQFRYRNLTEFDSRFQVCTALVRHKPKTNTAVLYIYPTRAENALEMVLQACSVLLDLNASFEAGGSPHDAEMTTNIEKVVGLVAWSQEFLAHLEKYGGTFQERHSVHLRYEDGADGVIEAFLEAPEDRIEAALKELNEWSSSFKNGGVIGAREDRRYLKISKDNLSSVLDEEPIRDILKKHRVTQLIDSDASSNSPMPGTVGFTLVGDSHSIRDAWTDLVASRATIFLEEAEPIQNHNLLLPFPRADTVESRTLALPREVYYLFLFAPGSEGIEGLEKKHHVTIETTDQCLSGNSVTLHIRGRPKNVSEVDATFVLFKHQLRVTGSHGEFEGYDEVTTYLTTGCCKDPATAVAIKNLERRYSVRISHIKPTQSQLQAINMPGGTTVKKGFWLCCKCRTLNSTDFNLTKCSHCPHQRDNCCLEEGAPLVYMPSFSTVGDVAKDNNHQKYSIIGPKDRLELVSNEIVQYQRDWIDQNGNASDLATTQRLHNVPIILYYHLVVENASETLDSIASSCNIEFIYPEDPIELHLRTEDVINSVVEMTIRGTKADVIFAAERFEALEQSFKQEYGTSPEKWPVFGILELGLVEQWFWQSKTPSRQKEFERHHRVRIQCDEEDDPQNRHESRCTIFGRKDRLQHASEEMLRLERDNLDTTSDVQKKFKCLFYQRNPSNHQNHACKNIGYDDISTLRYHLLRVHTQGLGCECHPKNEACYKMEKKLRGFDTRAARYAKLTPDEKWVTLFQELFPNDPIPSPWANLITPGQILVSGNSVSVEITKEIFDIVSKKFLEEIKNIMESHHVLIQFVPPVDPKEARIFEGQVQDRFAAARQFATLVNRIKDGEATDLEESLHENIKDQKVNDFVAFEHVSETSQDEEDSAGSPAPQLPLPEGHSVPQRNSMFQCPVWQMDVLRRNQYHCRGLGARSMGVVRHHIRRAHKEIFLRVCKVCKEDILDSGTYRILHGESCASPKLQQQKDEEQQWLTLCRKLYPDASELPSPYTIWQEPMEGAASEFQSSKNLEDYVKPSFFPFKAVAIRDHGPLYSTQHLSFRSGETVLVMDQLSDTDSDLYWGTVLHENGPEAEPGAIPAEAIIHMDIWGSSTPFKDNSKLRCDICSRYFRSLALRSAHNRALHRKESLNPMSSLESIVKHKPEMHE